MDSQDESSGLRTVARFIAAAQSVCNLALDSEPQFSSGAHHRSILLATVASRDRVDAYHGAGDVVLLDVFHLLIPLNGYRRPYQRIACAPSHYITQQQEGRNGLLNPIRILC